LLLSVAGEVEVARAFLFVLLVVPAAGGNAEGWILTTLHFTSDYLVNKVDGN
jgi:hypothetical protein